MTGYIACSDFFLQWLQKILLKEGYIMEVISKEMQRLLATGSTLRAMFEEGKKMIKQYGAENVFDFSLGNPSTPTPAAMNKSMIDVINNTESMKLHGYMSNAGYDESRQAIAENLNKRFGTNFAARNVTMTVGAANALVIALKIIINPGDEVIVFAPFFLEYRNYISNFGGVTKVVPANPPTFMPDMEQFAAAINERTRAVIIDNPNNPSGVVYDAETIKKMAAILEAKQKEYGTSIFILSDEPYREIVYDGVEVPFLTKYYRNTMVAYSYSKSMSVPGERIGYLLMPDELDQAEDIIAASSIGIRVLGCVNAPSLQQLAIINAMDDLCDMSIYDKNRKLLTSILDEAGFEYAKPQGTFYLFMKSPIDDDKAFVATAKDKYQILVSSGAAFDCPGWVRIAYCVPFDRIERAKSRFIALGHEFGLN